MVIKVVSFNIHHGIDINSQPSISKISDLLHVVKADIINLQEVDMLRPSTGKQNQASFLAENLGMTFVYGSVREYTHGSYGNAILSRYPFLFNQNILLPDAKDIRYCLQADIRINNHIISIFNTHLGLNQAVRYKHLTGIILPPIINTANPSLLAGDLNAPPSSPEIIMINNYLTDTFTKNSGSLVNTFSSEQPTARIDYVFINKHLTPIDYYVINTDVSDHLPVITAIKI